MKFQSILPLTTANVAKAQVGQWFKRADGTKTQLVGLREMKRGATPHHFSDAGKGDGFKGRTQRFARARWHLANRHGSVEQAVKRAPSSVEDARLGKLVRQMVQA